MKTILTYHYRGGVERGASLRGRPSYRWHDGYSEESATGAWTYPWMTKRECQADAKRRKAIAFFVNPGNAQMAAKNAALAAFVKKGCP